PSLLREVGTGCLKRPARRAGGQAVNDEGWNGPSMSERAERISGCEPDEDAGTRERMEAAEARARGGGGRGGGGGGGESAGERVRGHDATQEKLLALGRHVEAEFDADPALRVIVEAVREAEAL